MDCFYCNYSAEEPKLIAQHIFAAHPNKRNGWAAKVLTDVERLNRKVDRPEFAPMSAEDRALKNSTKHSLSGNNKTVRTFCSVCNSQNYQELPLEYINSIYAWRNEGLLVITCQSCRN
jgi:hypothetical protein